MRLDWAKVSPDALKAMMAVQGFTDKSSLDHKLIELIKIRSSQINGCAYCLDMHTKDAIAIGESEQRLHVVAAWREAPFYSEQERVALGWCESLTEISSKGAPENLFKELQKHFTDEQIVELTLAIIVINGWNRLAVGFESEVGGYVSNRKPGK
ncbi:MAG TPA: carboxymuconolactone decarboxylase family protein [Ignavibacteriaceae bacterium]|jgi:AhpD family alkylhydroperoxidase|nr:MAG: Carboxymuconolactone decarboxylase family protein [Ignavibacteria bacterium ADurb.Bin266]OQY71918.1 MAG: carboxymuconolactone decarboxylase [Ignavibacteriales bacterium UTCHB2]HQF42858.1 carboxymuconolactone decarboxylase family protein [Ignavibacteriaceae bacterium]HQI39555.1 carboxymuconolactone decarboxylase family protein [Ignavibacteriaceae bacterium]HQJ45661.1 carboxymuconolactone decarboxylase family protein [Ignavibacteriaceae bacterium]